ncbi:MAG: hypothetical protein J7L07_06685 [Candidatus Odinarchaeota archaeon]|nr:hypothetical protein [Candidatus Odinarchaeota archaeon]
MDDPVMESHLLCEKTLEVAENYDKDIQVYHGGALWSKDQGKKCGAEDIEGMNSIKAEAKTVARITKIIKLGKSALEEK